MTSKCISGVLIVALALGLCAPTQAQRRGVPELTAPAPTTAQTAGFLAAIIGAGAALAVITIVVVEKSKKKTIRGCVSATPNGFTLINEKDKQVYTLFGDTSVVKAGDVMTLQGKKVKPGKANPSTANPRALEITKMREDSGACRP